MGPRARVAVVSGRAAAWGSRTLRRGAGGSIGGRVALAMAPRLLADLASRRTVVAVSGTNGKTTTTRFIAEGWSRLGAVATNGTGANLAGGITAALIASSAPRAALEVDELALPIVLPALRPAVLVLLNLSRDQLDRVGEVRRVAGAWRAALDGFAGTVVANADDPFVAWAVLDSSDPGSRRVIWVGAGQPWRGDAGLCPRCHRPLTRPRGSWGCHACALARPLPDWALNDDSLVRGRVRVSGLGLALPGRASRADAVIALATLDTLGLSAADAVPALRRVVDVHGRYATVHVGETDARLLLAKNPAGWAEVLDVTRRSRGPIVLAVNSRIADGQDPSWLWDVPFELLRGRRVIVSGERGDDLAVRLSYAEVAYERASRPLAAIERVGADTCDVIANYTAFSALCAELGIVR